MLLRFLLIPLFCSPIGIGQASEPAPDEQRVYNENKGKNKFKFEAHSSDEMLRRVWQKLIDIEERLTFLEENRHPTINRHIDPVSVYQNETPKIRDNKGIYELDRNTETLNETGFFILK